MAGATGDDGDVFQHGLAAIAKTGGFDGRHLEDAAELVDDERSQGFAVDILGDDEDRLAGFSGFAEGGHQLASAADFLFVDEDVDIIKHGFL